MNGKWVTSPGAAFFNILQKRFPEMPIVAEDLGDIDQPVRDLMAQFNLPGMALLLFAVGADMAVNAYTPHNHQHHLLVYTGTHDNNTVKGWYKYDASDEDRERLQSYVGRRLRRKDVSEAMVRLALGSVANIAIVPLQDILGLGQKSTMNKPSTTEGNWMWRAKPDSITPILTERYKVMIDTYGRSNIPKNPKELVSTEQRGLHHEEG
jgi:4-alpha-glucanotransferase